jgi:hypothetical protein
MASGLDLKVDFELPPPPRKGWCCWKREENPFYVRRGGKWVEGEGSEEERNATNDWVIAKIRARIGEELWDQFIQEITRQGASFNPEHRKRVKLAARRDELVRAEGVAHDVLFNHQDRLAEAKLGEGGTYRLTGLDLLKGLRAEPMSKTEKERVIAVLQEEGERNGEKIGALYGVACLALSYDVKEEEQDQVLGAVLRGNRGKATERVAKELTVADQENWATLALRCWVSFEEENPLGEALIKKWVEVIGKMRGELFSKTSVEGIVRIALSLDKKTARSSMLSMASFVPSLKKEAPRAEERRGGGGAADAGPSSPLSTVLEEVETEPPGGGYA